jgi:hypothetical protein
VHVRAAGTETNHPLSPVTMFAILASGYGTPNHVWSRFATSHIGTEHTERRPKGIGGVWRGAAAPSRLYLQAVRAPVQGVGCHAHGPGWYLDNRVPG